MDIAGGGGGGGVDVRVGVEPEEAELLALLVEEVADAGDGTGSEGVVAAEDEGGESLVHGVRDGLGGAGAGVSNFGEEAGIGCAGGLGFSDFDADVAAVGDFVTEGFEVGFEAGDAEGGGAHVDAAAGSAEVEGDAEDADAAGGVGEGHTGAPGAGGERETEAAQPEPIRADWSAVGNSRHERGRLIATEGAGGEVLKGLQLPIEGCRVKLPGVD